MLASTNGRSCRRALPRPGGDERVERAWWRAPGGRSGSRSGIAAHRTRATGRTARRPGARTTGIGSGRHGPLEAAQRGDRGRDRRAPARDRRLPAGLLAHRTTRTRPWRAAATTRSIWQVHASCAGPAAAGRDRAGRPRLHHRPRPRAVVAARRDDRRHRAGRGRRCSSTSGSSTGPGEPSGEIGLASAGTWPCSASLVDRRRRRHPVVGVRTQAQATQESCERHPSRPQPRPRARARDRGRGHAGRPLDRPRRQDRRRPGRRRRHAPRAAHRRAWTASSSSARARRTRRRCSPTASASATATPPEVDIAVDPLEGTRLCALGMPNALAVIALSERGTMFDPGPVVYMEKMAGGDDIADLLDLDRPLGKTVELIAERREHRRHRRDGRRARPPAPRGGHRRDPRRRRARAPDHRRRRRRRAARRLRRARRSTSCGASAARPRASSPPARSSAWAAR